jgi:hypothetical protein
MSGEIKKIAVLKCGPTCCVSCNIFFHGKIILITCDKNISLCCVQLNNVILGKSLASNKTTFQRTNYKSEIFVATKRKIACDIIRFRNGTCLSPYSKISSHCLHWFHSSDQEILRFLRLSGFDNGRQFCRDVFVADQQHYLVSCLMESDSRYKHEKNMIWKIYDHFYWHGIKTAKIFFHFVAKNAECQ